MVDRMIKTRVQSMLEKFPVVTLTGTRQCGKSTLLKAILPDYTYVSLEDMDIREFAKSDPRGFLKTYDQKCIFDEAQRTPELFSYIQTEVDASGDMGRYVLSGSHNFLLMQSVSQSLAGRAAILTLAPFTIEELSSIEETTRDDPYERMWKGFFPAIFDRKVSPVDYFPSYVQTYLERDVRLVRNISDTSAFIRFVKLLAARSGQTLNYGELSGASGVSVPTVRAWISVLEQSYVIFFLQPYYKNFSKRLVKTPKLFFYDTGLLCYLLGIESIDQLKNYDNRGAVFETMVVSDYVKTRFFIGKDPACYFWRDSNQNEVDMLAEHQGRLTAYEIKLSATMDQKFLETMGKIGDLASIPPENRICIYTGDKEISTKNGCFRRYDHVFRGEK